MIPIKLTNDTWPPKDGEFCSSIVLYYDNWNDYSYRTSLALSIKRSELQVEVLIKELATSRT